jgi:D-3-phosphoglycerate dehydrogenase
MNVQVYRTGASSYQNSKFLTHEQRILEKIPGVKYINSLKETQKDVPFILITNTHTNIEEIPEVILDKTILMVHPNSGHDNFPIDFIENAKFPIILGNPIRSHAVTEYIMSCIFKEITSIPKHSHWPESRSWNRKLLRDQRVLILGNGHIGKILNESLKALTKEITIFDPYSNEQGVLNNWHEDIPTNQDILILAANSNHSNFHMVDKSFLSKLSPQNIIINPARGSLIKEEDLVQYLMKNQESKCYLDVFEQEPFKPGHLNDVANLNKTSHIAGVFEKLNHDIVSFEFLIIDDFLASLRNSSSDEFFKNYQECILVNTKENLRIL